MVVCECIDLILVDTTVARHVHCHPSQRVGLVHCDSTANDRFCLFDAANFEEECDCPRAFPLLRHGERRACVPIRWVM